MSDPILDYPPDAKVVKRPAEPYRPAEPWRVVGSDGVRRMKWRHRVVAQWFRDGQEYGMWWWEGDDE